VSMPKKQSARPPHLRLADELEDRAQMHRRVCAESTDPNTHVYATATAMALTYAARRVRGLGRTMRVKEDKGV